VPIEVTELYQHRHGEMQGSTHGTRRDFHVRTPLKGMGDVMAISATDIPTLNDFHPHSSTLWCYRKTCKPVNNEPTLFHVVCHYGIPGGSGGIDPDPTDRVATVRWTSGNAREDVAEDLNGLPIVNSAGDMLEGVTRDAGAPLLTIIQNELPDNFTAALAVYYKNLVNKFTWYGAAPNEVKISDVSAVYVEDITQNHWQVSLTFAFRYEDGRGTGWNPAILDAGLREKVLPGVQHPVARRRIMDELHPNVVVARPVLLDGDGTHLPSDATRVFYMPNPAAVPPWTSAHSFALYRTGNFSTIGIRWPPGLES
jgi:hypothetical protein